LRDAAGPALVVVVLAVSHGLLVRHVCLFHQTILMVDLAALSTGDFDGIYPTGFVA
jgi:hypothetical protein